MKLLFRGVALIGVLVVTAAPVAEAWAASLFDESMAADGQTILSSSTPIAGSLGSGTPTTVAYFTEVPCPIKTAVHHPIAHRRRVRRHIHHVIVHHHHRPHRHHPKAHVHRVARAPERCQILHRDRLYNQTAAAAPGGDFGANPVADAALAAGPPLTDLGGGGAPFSFVPAGGGLGSSPSQGLLTSTGPVPTRTNPNPPGGVSGAPEPGAWVLMILGAGVAGLGLRRRGKPDGEPGQTASLGRS